MVVSWYLLSPSLILLTAVYSRGTRYPPHVFLWSHYRGAMFQELKTILLHEESVTWKIMTSVIAKIWKSLVNIVNVVVAVAKNSILVFNSNSRVFNSIFNSTNFNSNSGIGIELQFQFRNWIDRNPATCPHNTPHIPSCYINEQTTKQKSINSYIHISCKCDTNHAGHFTLDAHASRPVACSDTAVPTQNHQFDDGLPFDQRQVYSPWKTAIYYMRCTSDTPRGYTIHLWSALNTRETKGAYGKHKVIFWLYLKVMDECSAEVLQSLS